MLDTRRRRLAWLFALVLLMELALLCCASVHISSHDCSGQESCAICAMLRPAIRCAFAVLALALGIAAALLTLCPRPGRRPGFESPVARRVRMND